MVNWKTIAIVFIILFSLLLALNIWAYFEVVDEERAVNECYYDVCAEYPQAYYNLGVCSCYEIDEAGDYEETLVKIIR